MTSGNRINSFNGSFFDKWSPNMAYILGFTCADGCVHKRTLSWELSNKFESDRFLLERFNKELDSTYSIEDRYNSFRLRINSICLVRRLEKLGIVQNKTKILKFPDVPEEVLRHFVRGFLDGDGWIAMRNKRKNNEINLGFSSGSKNFMQVLVEQLRKNLTINNANLRTREKITPLGVKSIFYQIDFYGQDAYNIIGYLFNNLTDKDLFLIRKYQKQINAKNLFEESQKTRLLGRSWVKIEKNKNLDFNQELDRMFVKEGLLPREIASNLGVSLATVYRWLEKANLRTSIEKGSLEWKGRILSKHYGKDTIVQGDRRELQKGKFTT